MPRDLTMGEVHVWWTSLDDAAAVANTARALLSPDEVQRAEAFRFERDRARFIAARATLRSLLASYLDVPASTLRFHAGPYGKPYVAPATDLQFNVSHSRDLALYAVSRCRAVGVDVEYRRELPDTVQLARRVLAPLEFEEFLRRPEADRLPAFFTYWTRKEAYAKGTGEGIGTLLKRIEVADSGAVQPIVIVDETTRPVTRWELRDLSAPPGYAAAVAVEGTASRVVERWWHPKSERNS